MKRHFSKFRLLSILLGIFMLWGCDEVTEDVVPSSFKEFALYPDEIYTFNSNSGYILRLDPLVNDSIKVDASVTYSQPLHGQLFNEFDGPGTMGYRPDNDFYGVDSITYTVCIEGSCKSEKIKLIVEEPFDKANCTTVLGADSLETTMNTHKELRIFLNDIICFDDNYGGLTIWKPEKGTYRTIDYAGSYKNTIYVYYPPKNYVGEDSFRYRVYTNRDRSEFQEVIVKVTVK